jgi:predicted hotdog family 3-hydroxylacyl-ACP dehydratase
MTAVDRTLISELIPHQGAMALLDQVATWDETIIIALSATHRATDNPLRSNGRLRAVHLCEYGAQAAALHGGLIARAAGGVAEPGYLVALRDVTLLCQYLDDLAGELQLRAELLLQDGGSWQYQFSAAHAGLTLASGRLAIIRRK